MKKNIKTNTIESVFETMKYGNVFDNIETYEEMPIVDCYPDLKKLDNYINISDRLSVAMSMAITYVNMGLVYAKRALPKENFSHFMLWFEVDMDFQEGFEEYCYYNTKLCYSQKAGLIPILCTRNEIRLEDSTLYPLIKDVVGLGDFLCFADKNKDNATVFVFIPRSMSYLIKSEIE